jgi:hypothetical protein
MKPCVKCGSTDRYDSEPGRGIGRCRPCLKARNDRRARDPGFLAQRSARAAVYRAQESVKRRKYEYNSARILRVKYGITPDRRAQIVAEQHGRCACCGDVLVPKATHVDHDHTTGQVRGVLCQPCNLAEGYLKGSSLRARKLAAYLDRHAPKLRLA